MAGKPEQSAKPPVRRTQAAKSRLRADSSDSAKMLKLIEAAEDIFLAKGYHTATMSDVAAQAGMSKKTVYQLIESKGELFAALLTHHQSLLVFPEEQPGWTVHDLLTANLLCLARFLISKEQIAIVRLIMAEYTHSPDLGRVFHLRRVQKARSRLETCLSGIAARKGCVNCNAKEMSAMLFGMAVGEFFLGALVGFRHMPSKAALENRVRNAVDIFLSGYAELNHP
jgi:AcrR family transcriptional regulator